MLTGYTSTGGLSEAEQMKATWDEQEAPALLEVAGATRLKTHRGRCRCCWPSAKRAT